MADIVCKTKEAALPCSYCTDTKAWEPIHSWPPMQHRQDVTEAPE
jgi:hypothetical protein